MKGLNRCDGVGLLSMGGSQKRWLWGCYLIPEREGACHALGMLMSEADMPGQESWEWPVYEAAVPSPTVH